MIHRTILFGALALTLGCGARTATLDEEPTVMDGGPRDAGRRDGGRVDAGRRDAGACDGATWELVSVPATSIHRLGAFEGGANTERTVRFGVVHELQGCDEPAMPTVGFAFEDEGASIGMRVFRPREIACPPIAEPVQRVVAIRFPRPGRWTVAADGAPEAVTVDVSTPPARECFPGRRWCEMDCDCPTGEACLDGYGLGGAFLACARSCEVDRDCDGAGTCESPDDGLEYGCREGGRECASEDDCPEGFACEDEVCVPAFDLGGRTRVPCRCDADCVAPLRCAVGPFADEGRCEILCPSGGPYCAGPHACGAASEDLAGLAPTDSVCVWLGE